MRTLDILADPQRMLRLKVSYIKFRVNPENDDVTDGMWCGQNGMQPDIISALRTACPKIDFEILEARRAEYAKQLAQVDQALFDKAIKGDAKAADLIYRRFESWSPKHAEEHIPEGSKTFADLIGEDDDTK